MGQYAKLVDVQARIPYRKIEETSSPSSVDAEAWVEEAETYLVAVMEAANMQAPAAGTAGATIVKSWVVDYVEGRLRSAWAAAGGQDSDVGDDLITKFNDRLDSIANSPGRWVAVFGTVSITDESHTKLRSNTTDTSGSVTAYDSKYKVDGEF